jgi:hypothetical protein
MLVHLLEPFWRHAYAHETDRERAVHKSINYTKTHSVDQGFGQASSHSTSQKILFLSYNENIYFFFIRQSIKGFKMNEVYLLQILTHY